MANEKRLIVADALETRMGNLCDEFGTDHLFIDAIIYEIGTAHTVDAAPVVHGRCEYCKDGKSFIGARMLLGNDGKWHDINNCPNCGAKMDGDGNG